MQVNIGIIGLGTVAGGTVQILQRHADLLETRAGCRVVVKRIATRTPARAAQWNIDPALVSDDVDALLNDPDIHIVAELIGGVEPALGYVLRAIENGKSVVTANKELIAKHGGEIFRAANAKGVDVLCEGSVGGGIPLLKPLRESLIGNRVTRLIGILNGTTNYILTKMTREGGAFADVLKEAQDLGYAEADPTADVDGYDAMYKLAILADIAFGTPVSLSDIYREGIRGVAPRDIEYARELGFVIKLVAIGVQHEDGKVELRVHPALLPREHPLANVNDVYNAVLLHGDATGDVMFYGQGAGSAPTGSAIVADLIEAARNWVGGARGRLNVEVESAPVLDFAQVETRFCIRMQVADRPRALAEIATIFGDEGVSVESIVQKRSESGSAELFWTMHATNQCAMARSLEAFSQSDAVREVSSVLRIEGIEN